MNKIIVLVILSMLLTACTPTTEKRITDTESQIQELKHNTGNTLFDKKLRCGMLSGDIQKRVDAIQQKYAELGSFSVGEVFYSPIKDACLWTRIIQSHTKDWSPSEKKSLYQFGQDFAGSDPIMQCEKNLTDTNGVNACEKWENEIIRLKSENTENPRP